jgi:carboxypeptidase C (cathepsin A)
MPNAQESGKIVPGGTGKILVMKSLLFLSLLLLSPLDAVALAKHPTPHPQAITRHTSHINGAPIAYTATVAEDIIKTSDRRSGAAVVTITYLLEGVRDRVHRPVLFAFNGGPGASSSALHLSGLGPMVRTAERRQEEPFGKPYVENTSSPLDVADLVFIDPVSTGFSRPLPDVDPQEWYGGKGDALEVTRVIKDWLVTHGRQRSPLYLVGESYGTTRAGLIVKYATDLEFSGVILVSGGGGSSDPNTRAAELLANMAAGAWFHQKVDRRGLTAEQFYSQALTFGRTDYVAALNNANLTPLQLHEMAERVKGYIGLPTALIESSKLVLSPNEWMFNLLKDQGLRTGLLDSRVTGKWCPNMQGALDDPTMAFVPPDICTPEDVPLTPASIGAKESPAAARYLREELRFVDSGPYYGVNLTVNSLWGKGAGAGEKEPGTARIMADAMKADPRLRLAAISGFYDLGSGTGSGFVQAGVPTDRLTLLRFPSPHEVYDTAFGSDEPRKRFDEVVRTFVTAGR